MPISNSDHLFQLVKSLDKSEKRVFKLFTQRLTSNQNVGFIDLFDLLNKSNKYSEEKILSSLAPINKSQLSNLKRHLYSQILKSLRIVHSQKYIDIHIRELIDSSKILYSKGLYIQALKILDMAKILAIKANQDFLMMQIFEQEKLIESRHITRSRKISDKVETLIKQSEKTNKIVISSSDLLILNLKIHGLYIKMGFVKNEKDLFYVKSYFSSILPSYKHYRISFYERIYLLQSFVWYHYTVLQFPQCYHNSYKWIELFHSRKNMIRKDPDLYMRGLHYLLITTFYMRHFKVFMKYFEVFEKFYDDFENEFNKTSQLVYFIYGYNAKLNYHFLKGTYSKALELLPEIRSQLTKLEGLLDTHRKIMFTYKIAWLYFGLQDYDSAMKNLNLIHNLKKEHLRNDIECYTRLFILMCQIELGHYELVRNLIPGTQRFFKSRTEVNVAIQCIFDYLKTRALTQKELPKTDLVKLYDLLIQFRKDKFTQRVFIYINFTAWIKSKIENCTIPAVIEKYYLNHQ